MSTLVINRFIKPTTILKEEQEEAVKFFLSKGRCCLADKVGKGKTLSCLAAFAYLKILRPEIKMIMVAIRKSTINTWKLDFEKHMQDLKISYVIDGKEPIKDADIFITNIYNMREFYFFFSILRPNVVVAVDEAHRIANAKTIYFRVLDFYCNKEYKLQFLWYLSATPLVSHLERVYYFFLLLYPQNLFGSFKNFIDNFADTKLNKRLVPDHVNGGFKEITYREILRYKNVDRLMALIKPFYLKRDSDDGPKPIVKYIQFDISKDEEEVYYEAVKGLLMERSPGNRAIRIVDCQYALDIPWTFEDHSDLVPSKLRQFVSEVLNPVLQRHESLIVYSTYRRIGKTLKQLFESRLSSFYLDGTSSLTQINDVKKEFNKNDGISRVLFCTDALSESHNFEKIRNLCFYSLPFDAITYLQMSGRIMRSTSEYPDVNIYIMMALDTIDAYKDELIAIRAKHITAMGHSPVYTKVTNNISRDLVKILRRKYLWRSKIKAKA